MMHMRSEEMDGIAGGDLFIGRCRQCLVDPCGSHPTERRTNVQWSTYTV